MSVDRIRIRFALIVSMIVCSACAVASITFARAPSEILYASIDGTEGVIFGSHFMKLGHVGGYESRNPNSEFADDVRTTLPMNDCSNAEYRCMDAHKFVFAIPRGRFTPGITYSRAGALLKIVSCTVTRDRICESAIFESYCAHHANGECDTKSSSSETNEARGIVTYFVASADNGIESMGFTVSGEPPSLVATQFILVGKTGLLSARRWHRSEIR
jgi:hypothetical protein